MADMNFTHGGNVHEARRRLGRDVIDFSANINPLGLPRYIKKLISDNLDSVLHYPDPEAKYLTKRIARYWGIDEENILVGNGSMEMIYLVAAAFKPKTALIASPDFSEYERALSIVKSRIRFLKMKEEDGFRLDLSHPRPSDIFFLSNPHNPTGNVLLDESDRIEKLPNKVVVVDEAFMDFMADEKKYTMIRKAVKSKRVIVLRTFTKFFAMPGLRVGYLIAHKDTIRLLKRYQAPWSVNSLAQVTAAAMLDDGAFIDAAKAFMEKERIFLFSALAGIRGLKPYRSAANFLLVKIEKKGLTGFALEEGLARKGILIRDCSNFRGLNNKFIRLAVRSRRENIKLLSALGKIL